MAVRSVRWGAIVAAAVLAVASGCTPSAEPTATPTVPSATPTSSSSATPSLTPTPTPTPTPTWNPLQAAAIKAVEDYSAAFDQIGADPSAFTEEGMTQLLEKSSGDNALESTVAFLMSLKENQYRRLGSATVLKTLASDPVDDGRGDEVHVTTCRDQTAISIVDNDGAVVTDDEFAIPAYNLRQLSVRKPPGEEAFRVFGFQTITGSCP